MADETYHLTEGQPGLTLAAALKRLLSDQSWSQVRKLISSRRVQVNGNLCLDHERHVAAGDVVKVFAKSLSKPVSVADVRLVYVDQHLVVVQKPAGVTTLRHREETDLPTRRKQLQPTLDELVQRQLAARLGIPLPGVNPKRERGTSHRRRVLKPDKRLKIRPVHRLDRDTSGLMLFARTPQAEQTLTRIFAKHEVERVYVAVVHGRVETRTIDTWLIRDRGDGLRGSTPLGDKALSDKTLAAQRAVTHIQPMQHLSDHTVIECRLETGRTHQIRIHLSEIGHPLCGERLYTHSLGQPAREDTSGAPRQALHAAALAFMHPLTGEPLRFRMPLPTDLRDWLLRLRGDQASA